MWLTPHGEKPFEVIRQHPKLFINTYEENRGILFVQDFLSSILELQISGIVVTSTVEISPKEFSIYCVENQITQGQAAQMCASGESISDILSTEITELWKRVAFQNVPVLTCVALTSSFSLQGRCRNEAYHLQFEKGELIHSTTSQSMESANTLEINFSLDPEFFGDGEINVDELKTWLEMQCMLVPGMGEIQVCDSRSQTAERITYPNGKWSWMDKLFGKLDRSMLAYPEIVHLKQHHSDYQIEVLFSHYVAPQGPIVFNWVNGQQGAIGGANIEGLWNGLVEGFQAFADSETINIDINKSSVKRSMIVFSSVVMKQHASFTNDQKLHDAEFCGTGQSIYNLVREIVSEKLLDHLRYEPELGRAILSHVEARI